MRRNPLLHAVFPAAIPIWVLRWRDGMADPDGNEFCVLSAFTPDELATIVSEAGA